MTGPVEPAPESPPSIPDLTAARPPRAPSLFRFALEGRQAPALFVGGWLGTAVGTALALVGLLSGRGLAAAALLLVGFGLLSVGLVLLGGSQAIERRAAGEPWAGPSPVLLFLAIVAVTLFVAGIVGVILELLGVRLDRPIGDLLSVALQAAVFLGVVRLMVVGTGATGWSEMGLRAPPRTAVSGLITGAAFALPVVFLTGIVSYAMVQIVGEAPPSPLPPTGTAAGLGLHLVAGAGIAPFAEEVVFRGAALTAWLRTVGPTQAIVRSALLFAAAHALGITGQSFGQAFGLAVVASVARLPVALALGWIYVRTGTIWSSIGLHAAFNAVLIAVSESGLAAPEALGFWG
ncbi:MAG TPA: type II CAAX endopeptidase family protein [Candidatus Limnocylindrales bacterium]